MFERHRDKNGEMSQKHNLDPHATQTLRAERHRFVHRGTSTTANRRLNDDQFRAIMSR